jgi:hypothetical protein
MPQIDPRETGNPGLIADPGNPIWKVKFKHIATGNTVEFTAWVNEFTDNFQSTWNEETAYGRMDPLVTFQRTQRDLTMQLDVVAANKFEAINNTAKVDKLTRFLYPVYVDGDRAFTNTLKTAPLIEMEWVNLVSSGPFGGLVGFINGLNYSPVFESGLFINSPSGERLDLFPQQLKLNINMKVIHTHLTGWVEGSDAEGKPNGTYTFGGEDTYFPHAGGGPMASPADGTFQPCAEGPWIPDSAINTSENQRQRRLMQEEQVANRQILQQAGNPGQKQRRKTRQALERNRGWNYNAGCPENNTVTPSPAEQRANARRIREEMGSLRSQHRTSRRETSEFLQEAGVSLSERGRTMRQIGKSQQSERRETRRRLLGLD